MADARKADQPGMASMALVSSFAIQGRVSASSDPLMMRVGQSTLLALERASNGPMANESLSFSAIC